MAFIDINNYDRGKHAYESYNLTEYELVSALAKTNSVREAARSINVSYPTFKKYAKMYTDRETGMTLLEKYRNPQGKGVKRNYDGNIAITAPHKYFKEGQNATPERVTKLRKLLIEKKLVEMNCHVCGYDQARLSDLKKPLLLNFKNKIKSDWRLENLQMVCYNCYFLHIGNPLTQNEIANLESYSFDNAIYKDKIEEYHQLDEVYLNHLKDLGLDGQGDVIETYDDVVDYKDDDEDSLVDHI